MFDELNSESNQSPKDAADLLDEAADDLFNEQEAPAKKPVARRPLVKVEPLYREGWKVALNCLRPDEARKWEAVIEADGQKQMGHSAGTAASSHAYLNPRWRDEKVAEKLASSQAEPSAQPSKREYTSLTPELLFKDALQRAMTTTGCEFADPAKFESDLQASEVPAAFHRKVKLDVASLSRKRRVN
jgi:hypothetical protein